MTPPNTKSVILDAARAMVQAHGYNALSFRDVANAIGIKSASIHYHFPTKGDLGAALAKRYTDDGKAYLEGIAASTADVAGPVGAFIDIFRAALLDDNRMCLVGIMAAEYADLSAGVRAEIERFSDVCARWLEDILSRNGTEATTARHRAFAIFAAIQGAQLVARGRNDIALFDRLIATYRESKLIP